MSRVRPPPPFEPPCFEFCCALRYQWCASPSGHETSCERVGVHASVSESINTIHDTDDVKPTPERLEDVAADLGPGSDDERILGFPRTTKAVAMDRGACGDDDSAHHKRARRWHHRPRGGVSVAAFSFDRSQAGNRAFTSLGFRHRRRG
jgi:hypothetical protein